MSLKDLHAVCMDVMHLGLGITWMYSDAESVSGSYIRPWPCNSENADQP